MMETEASDNPYRTFSGIMTEAMPMAIGFLGIMSVVLPALLAYQIGNEPVLWFYAIPIFIGTFASAALLAGVHALLRELRAIRVSLSLSRLEDRQS